MALVVAYLGYISISHLPATPVGPYRLQNLSERELLQGFLRVLIVLLVASLVHLMECPFPRALHDWESEGQAMVAAVADRWQLEQVSVLTRISLKQVF